MNSDSSDATGSEIITPGIRNAQREIENQIERLENVSLNESPLQLNLAEICTDIEQNIVNHEDEPIFSELQNKAERLKAGGDLVQRAITLHQKISATNYTKAVNEVIEYEKLTEIAGKILTYTEAEERKERSVLRLARKFILQTIYEDDEAEDEERAGQEVQARQPAAEEEQEVPRLHDANVLEDVPMEEQLDITFGRGIIDRQEDEIMRAPTPHRFASQDAPPGLGLSELQSLEPGTTAELEPSIVRRVDRTMENLASRASDSNLIRHLGIEGQDVYEPVRRSDIPAPLTEHGERTREEELEEFRRILEGNGDQFPMDIPEITDQELRAQGIDIDQLLNLPAEAERTEAEVERTAAEVERADVVESTAQRAEGTPARRRLFPPEPQDIIKNEVEIAQPLDEVVERPEFRRQRSHIVAPREVQDQIVPMNAEDDEILEMPPVEEELTPRRRRRRRIVFDEQIVIEGYAKRALRLNDNVVVERVPVYEGPPRIIEQSGLEFLMNNPGFGASIVRPRRLGDRLQNLYTRYIRGPPQGMQIVLPGRSPVQESPIQQPAVQAPQVPPPEPTSLSPATGPRRKRTFETAFDSPTAEIAKRLKELEEPRELVQVQEDAPAAAEVLRTPVPEIGEVAQPEIAPLLVETQEVPELEGVQVPQEMREHADAVSPAREVPERPVEAQPPIAFSPAERVLGDNVEVLEAPWAPGVVRIDVEVHAEPEQQAPELPVPFSPAQRVQGDNVEVLEAPWAPGVVRVDVEVHTEPEQQAPELPVPFSPAQRVLGDNVEVVEAPWAPGVIRVDVEVHAEAMQEQVQDQQAPEPGGVNVIREAEPMQEEIIGPADAILPAEIVEEAQPQPAPIQVITSPLHVMRSPVEVPPIEGAAPVAVEAPVALGTAEGVDIFQQEEPRQERIIEPFQVIPVSEIPERPLELEKPMEIPLVQVEGQMAVLSPRAPEAFEAVEEVQPQIAQAVLPQEAAPTAARSPTGIVRIVEEAHPQPISEQAPDQQILGLVDLPQEVKSRQDRTMEPTDVIVPPVIPERPLELEEPLEIPPILEGPPVDLQTPRTPEIMRAVEEVQPEVAPVQVMPPFRQVEVSPMEISLIPEAAPTSVSTPRTRDGERIMVQAQPDIPPIQEISPIRPLEESPVADLVPRQGPRIPNLENVPDRAPGMRTGRRRQGMVITPAPGNPWFISTKRNFPKAEWSVYDFVKNKLQEAWDEQAENNAVKSISAVELLRRSGDYNRENALTLVRVIDKLSIRKQVIFTHQDNQFIIYPFEIPYVTEKQMQCVNEPEIAESNSESSQSNLESPVQSSENIESSSEVPEKSSEDLQSSPEIPEASSGNTGSSPENIVHSSQNSESSMEI